MRHLVAYVADEAESGTPSCPPSCGTFWTPPSAPSCCPAEDGEIAQRTEELVGPYELHDFFLYYAVRWGFTPGKIYRLAKYALGGYL